MDEHGYCLVTNDDGWDSPGLAVLKKAVRPLVPVVVAPESERSAVGHAINLLTPVRVRRVKRKGVCDYICSGTPADCVKLGVKVLLDKPPVLVASGINLGPNLGMDLLYSGTVSAAMEGAILGFPSVAISLVGSGHLHWSTVLAVVPVIIRLCLSVGMPSDVLLNVNIPNVSLSRLRGYRITRQGQARFNEDYQVRRDPRGRTYYWLRGKFKKVPAEKGSDVEAVTDNYVSVCPLRLDLTDYHFQEVLQKSLSKFI
ncbi:MAG TPA: 5'/3'-nucleotidase SurE [bacterium]|nr:5'/3'-nucleotidase SurE [bacterium]